MPYWTAVVPTSMPWSTQPPPPAASTEPPATAAWTACRSSSLMPRPYGSDAQTVLARAGACLLVAGVGVAQDADRGVDVQRAGQARGAVVGRRWRRRSSRRSASSRHSRRRRRAARPGRRPTAVVSSALSSGQSLTASEPSAIASVMMFGWVIEPESMWSRVKATGARRRPSATASLTASASAVALAVAEPGDPGGQALPGARARGRARSSRVIRGRRRRRARGRARRHVEVGVLAGQADPAKRADPAAEQRPQVARGEDVDRQRLGHPAAGGVGADVVAVVEDHGAALAQRQHRPDVARPSWPGRAPRACRGRRGAAPPPPRGSIPAGR